MFHIDTKVSDRTLYLGVAKEGLYRPQVTGRLIDDGGLRSPHGMRTIILTGQTDARYPFVRKSLINCED